MPRPSRKQAILEALARELEQHPGDRITTAALGYMDGALDSDAGRVAEATHPELTIGNDAGTAQALAPCEVRACITAWAAAAMPPSSSMANRAASSSGRYGER